MRRQRPHRHYPETWVMFAEILAGLLLIPFGLATLMRGSDGMNAGRFGAGEGGVMALSGAGMVLSGVALLLGVLVAGALAIASLVPANAVWARERRRALGRRLRPADLVGRAAWVGVIVMLIIVGWQ